MDAAHLTAAVRCVENNPVAAGMVAGAADWPWSSAQSHVAGRRCGDEPLTDFAALGQHVPSWHAMLEIGLEAMDETASIAQIEASLRTGRPLASPGWTPKPNATFTASSCRQNADQSQGVSTNWGI